MNDGNTIDYILDNFPQGKRDEVYAVKKFLDNAGITFNFTLSNIECYPDEPADIWVKDIDKKFQVVVADFPLYEMAGQAKPDNRGVKFINMPRMNKEDMWREFVIKPIQKKVNIRNRLKASYFLLSLLLTLPG